MTPEKNSEIITGFSAIQTYIIGLDNTADYLLKKFDALDSTVDDLDSTVDALDSKVDALDHLDGKVDELSEKVNDMETTISDAISDYFNYDFKLSDHIDSDELVEAASDCIEANISSAVGRATTPCLMADAVSTAIRSDPCILDEFFKTHTGKSLLIDSLTELLLKGK